MLGSVGNPGIFVTIESSAWLTKTRPFTISGPIWLISKAKRLTVIPSIGSAMSEKLKCISSGRDIDFRLTISGSNVVGGRREVDSVHESYDLSNDMRWV